MCEEGETTNLFINVGANLGVGHSLEGSSPSGSSLGRMALGFRKGEEKKKVPSLFFLQFYGP